MIFRIVRYHHLVQRNLAFKQRHCIPKAPVRDFANASFNQKKSAFPRIEWFYIPAGVGFGLICLIQVKHIWKREQKKLNPVDNVDGHGRFKVQQWQVDLLKKLPTRSLSRIWGYCCDTHLPVWLRKPLINSYCRMFHCNLDEAVISDPKKYTTFNKFFTRQLKPGSRYVHPSSAMVSPADSTVLSFGLVDTPQLELHQVKGFTYPLKTFAGPRHPFYRNINSFSVEKQTCPLESDDKVRLYHITLYLGPGDYHWFHSPAEWTVEHRRHIPGHLFSVNPRVLRSINSIFNFNERVLLSGRWEHGHFLFAAIGAYNVGSIKLNFTQDKDLQTNSPFWEDKFKDRLYGTGLSLRRGESMGRFELGSSLVLVFTAPKDFEFCVTEGQRLHYGEPIGNITEGKQSKT